VGGTGRAGGSSGAVLRQGPITGALLGADGIQLGVLVRVTLRDSRSLSVGQMDRSLLLGGVVCIGVFYALLKEKSANGLSFGMLLLHWVLLQHLELQLVQRCRSLLIQSTLVTSLSLALS